MSSPGLFLFVAFAARFDKDSVAGVNFSRSKQYPCARIYEYSKCKPILLQ